MTVLIISLEERQEHFMEINQLGQEQDNWQGQ